MTGSKMRGSIVPFGEGRHVRKKVEAAARRESSRGYASSQIVTVKVKVNRSSTGWYQARACVDRQYHGRRRSGPVPMKCGALAHGKTPTHAVANALRGMNRSVLRGKG